MSSTAKVPTLEWVRECYNKLATLPGAIDPWHIHTHYELEDFVRRNTGIVGSDSTILNAGSGGKKLGVEHPRHVQIDVADLTLIGTQNAAVADVQFLPFRDSCFDLELCIGCVINYCDPVMAIGELARTLKPGGRLIIDYERSRSWEYLFHKPFGKDAHPVTTFYRDTIQVCGFIQTGIYETHYLRLVWR